MTDNGWLRSTVAKHHWSLDQAAPHPNSNSNPNANPNPNPNPNPKVKPNPNPNPKSHPNTILHKDHYNKQIWVFNAKLNTLQQAAVIRNYVRLFTVLKSFTT